MRFFLCVFLTCIPLLSQTETIKLLNTTQSLSLGKHLYYYIDKENKLTIDEIGKASNQKLFIKNTSLTPEFGYIESTVWLRFSLQEMNPISRNWILEIAYSLLDRIEFYFFDTGKWVTKYAGDENPFSDRELSFRNFVFFLSFVPNADQTFYLKIKTTSAAIIPLTLFQEKEFFKEKLFMESWHFLYYGALLVMIFYNGFIFLSFRSLSYLLYALSTLSMLMYQVTFNGHGFQYLWQDNLWIQKYAGLIAIIFFAFFTFEFMIRFLDLHKRLGFFLRILQVIQNLIILIVCLVSEKANFKLVAIIGFLNTLIAISTGVISWVKGYKAARFFVIAWVAYSLGAVLASLRTIGIIETNFITTYSLQIGSLVELVFLSIALADRYKLIMDENNSIQAELLEIEIKNSNTLEQKVKERTFELDSALTKLNQSMSSISNDLTLAKKIQTNTLLIKPSLLKDLNIYSRYIPMSEVGGDFYDITKIGEFTYRIFQADATGHGVQAAMITMAIKGIYDNIKNFDLDTSELIEIFNNDYISKYESLGSLMTAIIIDIDIKNHKLKYTSAGHPAAVLLKKDEMILLKNTGKMIGVVKNTLYKSLEFEFIYDDKLFVFTDGIFEEFNSLEEEFGEERLYSLLIKAKDSTLEAIIEDTLKQVDLFLEQTEKQDDITILGIEYRH